MLYTPQISNSSLARKLSCSVLPNLSTEVTFRQVPRVPVVLNISPVRIDAYIEPVEGRPNVLDESAGFGGIVSLQGSRNQQLKNPFQLLI